MCIHYGYHLETQVAYLWFMFPTNELLPSSALSRMQKQLWTYDQKKEHYQRTVKQSSDDRRWRERKKQRVVLRRAGRKCFLFQSVLYPPVIKNKGTRKKEGKLLKSMKKVCSAPGAGCPLLTPFHKHFVQLSAWWPGRTACWTDAWSIGPVPDWDIVNCTHIHFLCPSMSPYSV